MTINVLIPLQRSEYEDLCLNEECMIKIVKTDDGSTASNEALSIAGHVPSSSVSVIILRNFNYYFVFITFFVFFYWQFLVRTPSSREEVEKHIWMGKN